MPTCNTCREWYTSRCERRHACPPKWLCCQEDGDPSDGNSVYATDARSAAEKYAVHVVAHWGDDVDGSVVRVRPAEGGEETVWEIERVVSYSASPWRGGGW